MIKPFRLWCSPSKLKSVGWGVVAPLHLQFETEAEGEVVAARYRATYPAQRFAVSIARPEYLNNGEG
jgi:hypothetical protein